MAVPSDIYTCDSFIKALKKDPQSVIDVVFLADIDAGAKFGAPRRVCRHLKETDVRSHPLYKPLLHTLVLAWREMMTGLEVRPVPGAGHGLFVADASKLNTKKNPQNDNERVLHLGFTVKVPLSNKVDTHRIDISSQQNVTRQHVWWLHGPIRLCNDEPTSLMSLHYNGRATSKEVTVCNFPTAGEMRWNYFKGEAAALAKESRVQMMSWTHECCKVVTGDEEDVDLPLTQEPTPAPDKAQQPPLAPADVHRIVNPEYDHPDFLVVPEPEAIPEPWPVHFVKVFELCPLCGTPNRLDSRTNQKLHLLQKHAHAILLRQPTHSKQAYEDELYIRVHELIAFCNVLWASKLIPVHLGLFVKRCFTDQGVQCDSPDQLLKEIQIVMSSSQFVPFIFDGQVKFIQEANLQDAFDMLSTAAAAVGPVGTPFSNKVATVSKSPEYTAAGDRGKREAQVYLLHAYRCLGHGLVGCRVCISVD